MKNFSARVLLVLLCLALLTPYAVAADYTPPFDVPAQAALMINLDSEMVIYEKNADQPIQPGALAQLMTVVLTMERVKNPASVTASMKGYIQDEMYKQNVALGGIRLAGLYRGEEVSVEKLMYAVMLPSANEAAMILADTVGDGSVPYFVELMNQRAKELGATDTVFTSPHGLPDPKAHTTLRDMVLIARHAMSLPGFLEIANTATINGGPTSRQQTLNWSTTNKLISTHSNYYNGAVSNLKDGFDSQNGAAALTLAKRDGYTYLLGVMGVTPDSTIPDLQPRDAAFSLTNRLYSWAFDTFRVKTLLEKGKSFEEIPLRLCWGKDFLRLMSADNFTALVPAEIEASSVKYELTLPVYVKAPIKKGDLIGEVRLVLADETIGRVGIVAAEEVEVSRALLLLDKLREMTESFWFKFIFVFLVVLMLLYLVLMVVRNRNRRRYGSRRRRR